MAARHEEEVFTALTRLAFAGDGLVFGFGMTVLAIRTWLKFWSHSKALQEIKETPVTRIADIRTLADGADGQLREEIKLSKKLFKVHEKETTSSQQQFEVFATKSKVKMPSRPWMGIQPPTPPSEPKHQKLVVVRGRVQTQASVESEDVKTDADALVAHNVSEKAVFIERTQTFVHTDLSNFLGWITQKDLVKFSHQMVPFVLAETEAPWNLRPRNAAIYVHINLDDSHHPMPLLTVHHQLHPVTASSYTLFQAMFGRRYPVGLLDEEKILPIGAEITAVGVLQTAPDGTPVIKASNRLPIFLTDFSREQLLVELAKGTKVLFWMSLAVSTVAAGVLGYSMVKNWVKWKQRQQQRRSQNNESSQERVIEDEVENLEDIPDGELCVVCFLRRRRAAFIHCGHRVCCVGCAQRVEHGNNPRCPVCRQPVTSIVRVYDS